MARISSLIIITGMLFGLPVVAAAQAQAASSDVNEPVVDALEVEALEVEVPETAAADASLDAPAQSEEAPAASEQAPAASEQAPAASEQAPAAFEQMSVATEQAPAAKAQHLDLEMEDVKKALVGLKRDLVILEEDLLFPASSQVSVFLSMDVGEFFGLDAVTLKLNGKEVTHHLYTQKQIDALNRGGVQKLFVGNVRQGNNRVTAFFTGSGPQGRDYRRATTVEFEKGFEPTFIELAITDETADYQPDFSANVVN